MSSVFLPGTDSEGRDGLCVRACVVGCPVERARALSLAAVYWGSQAFTRKSTFHS